MNLLLVRQFNILLIGFLYNNKYNYWEFFLQSNQYSIKVYETSINDEARFMKFFDVNYALFKDHLIVIRGDMSQTIKEYLDKKSLSYLQNVQLPRVRDRQTIEKDFKEQQVQAMMDHKRMESKLTKLSDRLQNNLTVLDQIIRSGRELNIEGDLLLLNRVNSGATITTTGNLIITQSVEGVIRCNGNFMMLTASPKAHILFHDIEVENKFLENRLNRIELKDNKIVITPVLEKEINWVS